MLLFGHAKLQLLSNSLSFAVAPDSGKHDIGSIGRGHIAKEARQEMARAHSGAHWINGPRLWSFDIWGWVFLCVRLREAKLTLMSSNIRCVSHKNFKKNVICWKLSICCVSSLTCFHQSHPIQSQIVGFIVLIRSVTQQLWLSEHSCYLWVVVHASIVKVTMLQNKLTQKAKYQADFKDWYDVFELSKIVRKWTLSLDNVKLIVRFFSFSSRKN